MRSANRELRSLLNSYQDQKLTQQQRLVLELVKKKRPSNFESFDNKKRLKKMKFAEAERVKADNLESRADLDLEESSINAIG